MMDKRKLIEQEVETVSAHRIECGHCGEVWETDYQTLDDFISEIETDFHYAISKDFGLQGLVCDSCFNDEDADWEEYNPKEKVRER